MESYLQNLDDFFCEQYSDYTRISALSGYKMPDVLYIGKDGNISRRDSSCMRLSHQENREQLLAELKAGLCDTSFTFNFCFVPLRERLKPFQKYTFAKLLPEALKHCGETVEDAGKKLDIEPRFWQKIVKGKLLPEKNTIFALALVCRMQAADVSNLLAVRDFAFEDDKVVDVVMQFLLGQRVFNEEMRDRCLQEYKITNLPIRRGETV